MGVAAWVVGLHWKYRLDYRLRLWGSYTAASRASKQYIMVETCAYSMLQWRLGIGDFAVNSSFIEGWRVITV